jgi:hypothetical protein
MHINVVKKNMADIDNFFMIILITEVAYLIASFKLSPLASQSPKYPSYNLKTHMHICVVNFFYSRHS